MATRNRTSIYSFGDKGVTASVSGFGRLLRVSQHFDGQDFGYCVDHPHMSEPYFVVDRLASLLSMTNDSSDSIGIDPKVHIPDIGDAPSAEFVHDRWPLFTIISGGFKIKIQFFASGRTIYQTYEFIPEGTDSQPPKLTMNADLLIRQLDFIDGRNTFNEHGPMDDTYRIELLKDMKGIKRSHYINEGEVALFILACSNDQLLTFKQVEEETEETEDEDENRGEEQEGDQDTQTNGSDTENQQENNGGGKTLELVWSDEASEQMATKKSLKVTFAYRLELSSKQDESTDPPVNTEMMRNAAQHVNLDHFGKHDFTANPDVDPFLRRNLEYILSVCSIPVVAEGDKGEPPAIAFTCGDIDSHRVATAASFYCFEFLLLALDYFKSHQHPCPSPGLSCSICNMEQRIMKVCKGHLKWLFGKKYRNLSENPFAPHCWVSGKVIDEWDDNLYLAPKSLVEVPFQIIKAGDFFARDNSWKIPREVGVTVQAWIKELDQRNKLGRYAFPRYSKEPTHSFYFTDHVFIWRALKSAESLGLKSELNAVIRTESEGGDGSAKKSSKKRNYSSVQVQNQILKRFTTENPISKKRMIAVSRSPAHNRFLLRTKDAGLFDAMELGLFNKPGAGKDDDVWKNKVDIWRNLVDCQVYHEDNDDTTWDEPVRFALSFIMAQAGKRMNRRPVDEILPYALSVLLQSARPSGIFPGQLDANKEPIPYDDELMRDTYWAFSFEIPYILWKYSLPCFTVHGDLQGKSKNDSKATEAKTALSSDTEIRRMLQELLEQQAGAKGSTGPTMSSMKLSFPVNNIVDQKNIVELSDEWLYNEPDFFDHVSTNNESLSISPADQESTTSFSDSTPWSPERIAVVDIPRIASTKKNSLSLDEMMTCFVKASDFRGHMQKRRFQSQSKKRFCAFFDIDPVNNEACHQPASEQPAMQAFYDRHTSYDKFFSDVTEAERNKWTTELHLSFYSVNRQQSSSISVIGQKNLPNSHTLSEDERPYKIVMSFRFDGDFFDRYWTCHFLECDPQMASKFNIRSTLNDLLIKGPGGTTDKKEPWRQRRVLELLLFDRIMRRMQGCTADILDKARLNALKKPARSNSKEQEDPDSTENSLSHSLNVDYDAFRTTSSQCQAYQQLLQTVEQDLQENLDQIERWLNREKERVAERPRWTFNDESRYRAVISKLLVSNQHRIQDLRRSHASISSFNESLTKKLEIIRSELDQRRADDIKRFTYVTVVFLPLGFATGVFSMSEAPGDRTLIGMVLTAVVAFATTALLLKYAEPLEKCYKRVPEAAHRLLAGMSWSGTKRARGTHDVEAGKNAIPAPTADSSTRRRTRSRSL